MTRAGEVENPLLFASGGRNGHLAHAARRGELTKIGRGIYSRDIETPATTQARTWLWHVVAALAPDAVIVDRTAAIGGTPDSSGQAFVATGRRHRDIDLAAVTVRVRPPRSRPNDLLLPHGISITCPAQTVVDNLQHTRSFGGRPASTLSEHELDAWARAYARIHGARATLDLAANCADLVGGRVTKQGEVVADLFARAIADLPVTTGSGGHAPDGPSTSYPGQSRERHRPTADGKTL